MTLEELRDLCAEWQERLRLLHWEFDLRISRGYDIGGDSQATINFVAPKAHAIIKILDPVDWDPDLMGEQDMEKSLVHELLHARFAGVVPDDLAGGDYILEEQAIEALSTALVELKRGMQP